MKKIEPGRNLVHVPKIFFFSEIFFFSLENFWIFFSIFFYQRSVTIVAKKKWKKKNPKFSNSKKKYFQKEKKNSYYSGHELTPCGVKFFSVRLYCTKKIHSTLRKFSQIFGKNPKNNNDFWQKPKVCLSKNSSFCLAPETFAHEKHFFFCFFLFCFVFQPVLNCGPGATPVAPGPHGTLGGLRSNISRWKGMHWENHEKHMKKHEK